MTKENSSKLKLYQATIFVFQCILYFCWYKNIIN